MQSYLILDEQSVAANAGVSFALNPATKHPENPVLLPGEPHQWDSLQVSWPATVLYSEQEKKFRCWYSGFDAIQSSGRHWFCGYAESEDGVNWVKPELGLVTYLDRPTNRIVADWDGFLLSFVFENPDPNAPAEQRFGSYWTELARNADGNFDMSVLQKGLAWSPDGFTWKRAGTPYKGIPWDRPSLQDISQLIFDPEEADPAYRVKGYSQIGRPRSWDQRPGVRHIGLVHGEDLTCVKDAPDPIVLAPEQGIDEELHFATVRKIGDTYVMLFESDNFSRNPIHGDLRLAVSDTGRKFRRVHPTQATVPTGRKGMWDENLLVTTSAGIQDVGDMHYIFYLGCPNVYNSWPPEYCVAPQRRGSMLYPSYMGLATLPYHRFAYAEGPGSITTHALELQAGEFWVNAEGDELTLSARNESGDSIATGRLTEETDRTYRKVAWNTVPTGRVQVSMQLGEGVKVFGYQG